MKTTKVVPKQRAKALKNVLTVTVLDGKHYCACTSQPEAGGVTKHTPLVKMDEATEAALRELGVKFKKGKADA
ncbi:MAG: hypothetical protein JNL68_15755 [Burkholderiales bacterium]|nr:hypothetical protein [Burkholderiales bacterium]